MAEKEKKSSVPHEHVHGHFGLMNAIFAFQTPLLLRAVVLLDIPRLISKAGHPLSIDELMAHFPQAKNPQPSFLHRILDYLVHKKLFTRTVNHQDGTSRYGLTHFSQWLCNEHVEYLLLCTHPRSQSSYQHVHQAVLDGGNAFAFANDGLHVWETGKFDKEYNDLLNKGMLGWSGVTMDLILDHYTGFEGVKKLVDLGGGLGMCAGKIAEKYPAIKVINFDLPHIIADAPALPGVEHVAGSAFEGTTPEADAIFLKSVLINFNDEDSCKFLQAACNALPKGGKLILVELIHNKDGDFEFELDMIMIGFTDGGKSRSLKEHTELLEKSGFSNIKLIGVPSKEQVIEAYKV